MFSFASWPLATIMWWVLLLVGSITAFVTIVLYYHWIKYGYPNKTIVFTQVLYTGVLVVAFIVMIGSASSV